MIKGNDIMTSFFARITDKSRNVVINVNLTHSDYISTNFLCIQDLIETSPTDKGHWRRLWNVPWFINFNTACNSATCRPG